MHTVCACVCVYACVCMCVFMRCVLSQNSLNKTNLRRLVPSYGVSLLGRCKCMECDNLYLCVCVCMCMCMCIINSRV